MIEITHQPQLPQTLIILSGLPGTGKTTIENHLVKKLQIPILAIDDVID
jgi:tRNA uridine 5-carbamoylmethylation protein Kti12